MKTKIHSMLVIYSAFSLAACKEAVQPTTISPPTDAVTLYFPPVEGTWQTTTAASLRWNEDAIRLLCTNLEANGTRAFIVLKDGKIVLEKYWGKTLLGTEQFDAEKSWYWASAAKTLTAFVVGKAQDDGYLTLTDPTALHLGEGWTSLPKEQEDNITVQHQLTMTSGLNEASGDGLEPENLTYAANAGSRWSYHNAPYTLIEKVVSSASGQVYTSYFDKVIQNPIGMTGFWQWSGNNHLYLSNARSAARFGLLMQNKGVWAGTSLIKETFISSAINASQDLNKSYGYFWWLNGQESFMIPQSQIKYPGNFLVDAPEDVYSAMGKNGQYVSISPSNGLVMVRMGDSPDDAPVPFLYLNDIWKMMATVTK